MVKIRFKSTYYKGREDHKMGITEIIFIVIITISLGGCLVYSIIENNKKNK